MNNVEMVDLVRHWREIRTDVFAAIDKVGTAGNWILGEQVRSFESSLSSFCGVDYSIGCASGLDAIEIALRALELRPGDKVITTPLTAFATTLAIVKAGGVPLYVDVDEYGLIDLKQVVAVLENDPSIKFLVPVHLYGHSVNLVELRRIRECFGLKIVEDCAQSIGASNSNIKVGTVGQLAATSFYPTKNLGALGDGGAILTNIKALADVCSCIRDYGQSAKYRHDMLGMNSRLDELQAAVLDSVMLPRLSDSNQARANIAKKYLCLIDNISLKPLGAPPDTVSAWHLFPIFVKGSRDDFRAHLETKTISSSIHYPLLCNSQLATNFFDYEVSPNGLQNAEKICQSVVSIPLHPHMHESEVKKVINACNSW